MQRPTVRSLDQRLGPYLTYGAQAGLVVAAAVALLVTVTYQVLAITHPFPLDYGEAPLVDQAVRLAAGQNIYRPDLAEPPYTISNYPPVYVAALAPWVTLFGPSFAAGRLISTLSAWVAAGCLALMLYTASRDRWVAGLAGLVFLTFPYVTYWSGFLRVDMLALALSLAGLTLLVRWPAARWSVVAAGLLLVAAIYTRQSYALAAPLAAGVWLLRTEASRRLAAGLAALVIVLSAAIFLLLQAATDGGFVFNIVTANVNEYRRDILERNLEDVVDTATPLLALAGALVLAGPRRSPLYALAVPYLVGSGLSAMTVGKIGSNVNYWLEMCAALCLAAGLVLAAARRPAPARWHAWPGVVMAVLAVQTAVSLRTTVDAYASELGDRRAQTNDLHRLATLVAEANGPVLADEYMGLGLLQGQALYLQPFETTQLARAGVWDQTPLVQSIEEQAFGAILIYDRPWSLERWTDEELAAIYQKYRLTARLADTQVYQPYTRRAVAAVEACPGAPWQLPTSAVRGVEPNQGALTFFGEGDEGQVPVVAVASGWLLRRPDWLQAVAIEHEDPLRPGEKVWTYYGDLGAANGLASHIVPEFALGTEGVYVEAGELLGYQGRWSGRKNWAAWLHARFAVVRGSAPGEFPDSVAPEHSLDPAPYLGLDRALTATATGLRPLRCAEP